MYSPLKSFNIETSFRKNEALNIHKLYLNKNSDIGKSGSYITPKLVCFEFFHYSLLLMYIHVPGG